MNYQTLNAQTYCSNIWWLSVNLHTISTCTRFSNFNMPSRDLLKIQNCKPISISCLKFRHFKLSRSILRENWWYDIVDLRLDFSFQVSGGVGRCGGIFLPLFYVLCYFRKLRVYKHTAKRPFQAYNVSLLKIEKKVERGKILAKIIWNSRWLTIFPDNDILLMSCQYGE